MATVALSLLPFVCNNDQPLQQDIGKPPLASPALKKKPVEMKRTLRGYYVNMKSPEEKRSSKIRRSLIGNFLDDPAALACCACLGCLFLDGAF